MKWKCLNCGAINPAGTNECHACNISSPEYGMYNFSLNWSDKTLVKEALSFLVDYENHTPEITKRLDYLIDVFSKGGDA